MLLRIIKDVLNIFDVQTKSCERPFVKKIEHFVEDCNVAAI